MVEASRLSEPNPQFETSWVRKGALVVPYGTMSALPLDFVDIFDKFVMDDLGQLQAGPFGALRPHINAGKISEASFHAEIERSRLRRQTRAGGSRRDHSLLAPRHVDQRHRVGRSDVGEGAPDGVGKNAPHA